MIDNPSLRAGVATMAAMVGIDAVIRPRTSDGDELVTDGGTADGEGDA